MFKDHQKFLEEEQWGPSGGYIPAFKCWGWSNRGKNQIPKTSLWLPTKRQKIPFWISKPYNFQESIKLYNTKSKLEIKCLCFAATICRHHHESSHPKKELPNFRNLKKIPELKMSNPKTSFSHPRDLKPGANPPPPSLWEWGYLLQPHPLAHCSMTSTQMVTAVKEKRDKYKVASILQGMSSHNNNIMFSRFYCSTST